MKSIFTKKLLILLMLVLIITNIPMPNVAFAEEDNSKSPYEAEEKNFKFPYETIYSFVDENGNLKASSRKQYQSLSCDDICLEDPIGGGSLSDPARVDTVTVDANGVKVEISIVDGEFTIFKLDDHHYHILNAEQGYFNAAMGRITRSVANVLGTYLTYRGIDKIPYAKRIFDTTTKDPIYNWGHLKSASSIMIQYNAPIWGEIVSTPVPTVGTKEVVVYISKTGESNTWNHKVRFVIKPNGEITHRVF